MNRARPPKRLVKKIKKFVFLGQAKQDLAVSIQRILGARSAEWERIKNGSRTGPMCANSFIPVKRGFAAIVLLVFNC